MLTITPCLWFDRNVEEAVNFYTSIFQNSRIGRVSHYSEAGFEHHQMPAGTVLGIEFELNGMKFSALNGGPVFKFNEAISLQVPCETQQEVDYYWEKLSAGGDPAAQQCGWLKDKFGLSWQVFPQALIEMLADEDRVKADRVMNAMLQMKKIELAGLEQAYRQS
jgi:predicted 3-demethylubiquinone-9 3-methyltransferase (glyoxalase superfamily)